MLHKMQSELKHKKAPEMEFQGQINIKVNLTDHVGDRVNLHALPDALEFAP